MAFSHLINCLLLAYAPLFIIYRAKNLQDHRVYKLCLFSVLFSLITSFCKIFLLAAFSVFFNEEEGNELTFLLHNLVNLVDCYGIYLLQKQKVCNVDDNQAKVLAIGLGWAFMNCTLTHLFALIPNATQDEFTWVFIIRSLTSNLELFETIMIVGLVLTVIKNSKRSGYKLGSDIAIFVAIVMKQIVVPRLVKVFISEDFNLEFIGYKSVGTAVMVVLGKSLIRL